MSNNPEDLEQLVEGQRGIFGDECAGLCPALSQHETQKKVASPDGLVVHFDCSRCGRGTVMVVEWPEILALGAGVPPAFAYQRANVGLRGAPLDWKWDGQEQVWWPSLPCQSCRRPLVVWLSPSEIVQHVGLARARGFFPPQVEQVCAQVCGAAIQSMRQQMGR